MKVTTTQLAAMGYAPDGSKLTPANASKGCAREAELHRQILDYCRAKGWPVVHSRMDVPQTAGVGTPDFVVAMPDGQTMWVECKAGAGKLSSEQRAWMAGLVRLGHDAHVVRSMSEFLEVLR